MQLQLVCLAAVFFSLRAITYAKDYRVYDQHRYTGKIKTVAQVKEQPFLKSKTVGVLQPGDLVSVVSQQKDYFAIKIKQKPEKKIWIKKNAIQLYKKKQPRAVKRTLYTTRTQPKLQKKPAFKAVKKKHYYYIGLAHYRNIKQFSANQTGVTAFYERRLKQYGLGFQADFLYNDIFKTYSVAPGFRYHYTNKKNNYHLASALYVGYEKLYDSSRSVQALIADFELMQINYQYKSVYFVLTPLKLRAMVFTDQKIPVNYRYGISLGVKF
ncbi:hypothetical protein MRY82_05855 [bacterium]|nr:hypothetical protein [bacterium]